MSRMILILIVGTIISYGILNTASNDNVVNATGNAVDNFSLTQARNIANSTAEIIFSKLGDDINWRVNLPETKKAMGGEAIYSVEDAFLNGDSLIKISIMGMYNTRIKSVTIFTAKNLTSPGFMPPGVKAAITTHNNVEANGNLTVDGRNHTMSGSLISQKGTLGIWTTNSFNQEGNTKIGGTYYSEGVGYDIEPIKTGYGQIVYETQTYPDGFPDTPEKVLGGSISGYPVDKLKEIAKSGFSGSQYVTNPVFLKYPLKGITYVELPAGGVWQPTSINGSGILIIHNKTLDAVIKNLNVGVFRGLIIADDIIHIHADIIGAVVSLTTNPSAGNVIGNGNGTVKFSSEAIMKSTEFATTHNYGFGAKRINVRYWFE